MKFLHELLSFAATLSVVALTLLVPVCIIEISSMISIYVPIVLYIFFGFLSAWASVSLALNTRTAYRIRGAIDGLFIIQAESGESMRSAFISALAFLVGIYVSLITASGFAMRWVSICGWVDFANYSELRSQWVIFALDYFFETLLFGIPNDYEVHFSQIKVSGFSSRTLVLIYKLTVVSVLVNAIKFAIKIAADKRKHNFSP